MHLILRSTQATGEKSFKKSRNEKCIVAIIKKFSEKHFVKIINFANVGNHLHLQIQLGSRLSYKLFIRAITGAIALAIGNKQRKFWDHRPFTRIVQGFKDSLQLNDYIAVNRLEGQGVPRDQARAMVDLSG